MSVEGTLIVDLTVRAQRVEHVSITLSRRVDTVRALLGRSVRDALGALPVLFGTCADAHSAAAVGACEAALGIFIHDTQRNARELMVILEALDHHAWQVALKWPAAFGDDAAVPHLRTLRKATLELRAGIGFLGQWRRPGGPELSPDTDVAHQLETAATALHALLGHPLPSDLSGLEDWSRGPSVTQRAVANLMAQGLAGFGRSEVALLPPLPPQWFEAALTANPGFEARPTFEGHPAKTGALARRRDHPLIDRLLREYGNGLVTHFLARLVEMEELVKRGRALAPSVRDCPGGPDSLASSGVGTAVVETSRGTLAHSIVVDAGRVVGWRVVAPAEWNFHPAGALAEGLRDAGAENLHAAAALLVTCLDPCVAFEVNLHRADRACEEPS